MTATNPQIAFRAARKRMLFLVGCALVLALVALLTTGFSGSQVCGECGKKRTYSQWGLGFFDSPLLTVAEAESDTLVSRFFSTATPNCAHRWLFASGGHHHVLIPVKSCAIGSGRHLWKAIESPDVVSFLTDLKRQTNSAAIETWRKRLLDPKRSDLAVAAIPLTSSPNEDLADRLEKAEENFALFNPYKP